MSCTRVTVTETEQGHEVMQSRNVVSERGGKAAMIVKVTGRLPQVFQMKFPRGVTTSGWSEWVGADYCSGDSLLGWRMANSKKATDARQPVPQDQRLLLRYRTEIRE